MKPEKVVCENCAYFSNDNNCRRYAPKPIYYQSKSDGTVEYINGIHWPYISRDDWCGEFSTMPPTWRSLKDELPA